MAKTVRFEEVLPYQKVIDRLVLEELEDPALQGGAYGTAYRVKPREDFPIPGPGIMKVLELEPQSRQPERGAAWLPHSWVTFREEYQRLVDMDGLRNEAGEICVPQAYAWGYCSEVAESGREIWRAAIVMQEILPEEGTQLSKALKTHSGFSPEAVAQFGKLATDIIARQSQAAIKIAHRDLSPNNVFVKCSPEDRRNGEVLSVDRVVFIDYGQGANEEEEVSGLYTGNSRPPRMGTISYTSPEMIRKIVTPRICDASLKELLESHRAIYEMRNDYTVDVWSIGALMYKLRTGASPGAVSCDGQHYYLKSKGDRSNFLTEDDALIRALEDKRTPLSLDELRDSRGNLSEIDQSLSEIIRLCTAWDPQDRAKHFDEVRRRLAEMVDNNPFNRLSWNDVSQITPAPTPRPVPKVDLTRLTELIHRFEKLSPSEYTPETWERAKRAYARAKSALDETSQDAIDRASLELADALDRLKKRPDATELNRLLEEISHFSAEDYTTSSWARFVSVVRKARTMLHTTDRDDIKRASQDLRVAIGSLIKRPDIRALEDAIKRARALDKNSFTLKSWQSLERALQSGESARTSAIQGVGNTSTRNMQATVDWATRDLTAAISSLEKKPDTQALRDAIGKASALKGDDYTADSWGRLERSLKEAELALASESQDAVDSAIAGLQAATAALEKKPDTQALRDAIGKASALWKADYTADSWRRLEESLKIAEDSLTPENQDVIDAAIVSRRTDNLQTSIRALVKKSSAKALKSAIRKAVVLKAMLNEDRYTTDSWRRLEESLKIAEDSLTPENQFIDISQYIVDRATLNLQNAMGLLEKKSRVSRGRSDGSGKRRFGVAAIAAAVLAVVGVAVLAFFVLSKGSPEQPAEVNQAAPTETDQVVSTQDAVAADPGNEAFAVNLSSDVRLEDYDSYDRVVLRFSLSPYDEQRGRQTGISDALTLPFNTADGKSITSSSSFHELSDEDKGAIFSQLEKEAMQNPIYGIGLMDFLRSTQVGDQTIGELNPWMSEAVQKNEDADNGCGVWMRYVSDTDRTIITSDEYRLYAAGVCELLKRMSGSFEVRETSEVWTLNDSLLNSDRKVVKKSYNYQDYFFVLSHETSDADKKMEFGLSLQDKRPCRLA